MNQTYMIYICVFLAIVAMCRLLAHRQKSKLDLIYSKKKPHPLIEEFLQKSNIATMEFEPYTFGISPIAQTISFIFFEVFCQIFFPHRYERETFKIKDGGTLALDWDEGKPDPKDMPTKPLLIMIPGVAGDSDNLYQVSLLKHVNKDFKVVNLLMRGGGGIPITSARLNYPGSWQDIKEGVEYVYDKYVKDPQTGEKRCRYYIYGCSMGASTLGVYLVNDPDNSAKMFDGAVFYGTPWDYNIGHKKFFGAYGGWPSYVVAQNLCRVTRKTQLAQLK